MFDDSIGVRKNNAIIDKKIRNISFAVIGGFLALAGVLSSATTVPEGYRGVKTRFGRVVSNEPLQPGLHFRLPLIESVSKMDIRTKLLSASTTALTSDSQSATIGFAVNHNLSPDKVIDVYKKVGMDFNKILIEPSTLNAIQKVVGQTSADDLVNKKAQAITNMEKTLSDELKKNGVMVSTFSVPTLDFTREFKDSIEKKEIARQDSLREKYNTERAKQLAEQEIEKARGEAEALKLRAAADAEAIRMRAEAAASNPQALEFEALKQWDGRLPMVVGNDKHILDVSALLTKGMQKAGKPHERTSARIQEAVQEKTQNKR